jgi:hypothetical protein
MAREGIKKRVMGVWFNYRLERDPRFLARIEKARASLKTGRGVRLEDVSK